MPHDPAGGRFRQCDEAGHRRRIAATLDLPSAPAAPGAARLGVNLDLPAWKALCCPLNGDSLAPALRRAHHTSLGDTSSNRQQTGDRTMATNLMHMLAEGPVLGDGGMFLEANWRGYDVPEIIGTHPDALRQIHRDFYNAGSQVLQALTWFTSRPVGGPLRLARPGGGDQPDGDSSCERGGRLRGPGGQVSGVYQYGVTAWGPGFRSERPVFARPSQGGVDDQIAILVEAGASRSDAAHGVGDAGGGGCADRLSAERVQGDTITRSAATVSPDFWTLLLRARWRSLQ